MSPDGRNIEEDRWCSQHYLYVKTQLPSPQVRTSIPLSAFYCNSCHPWFQVLLNAGCDVRLLAAPLGRGFPASYDVRHTMGSLQGPMGLISTGDEFCRRGDLALEGIGDCAMMVDDVLVWDTTPDVPLQKKVRFTTPPRRGTRMRKRPDRLVF